MIRRECSILPFVAVIALFSLVPLALAQVSIFVSKINYVNYPAQIYS